MENIDNNIKTDNNSDSNAPLERDDKEQAEKQIKDNQDQDTNENPQDEEVNNENEVLESLDDPIQTFNFFDKKFFKEENNREKPEFILKEKEPFWPEITSGEIFFSNTDSKHNDYTSHDVSKRFSEWTDALSTSASEWKDGGSKFKAVAGTATTVAASMPFNAAGTLLEVASAGFNKIDNLLDKVWKWALDKMQEDNSLVSNIIGFLAFLIAGIVKLVVKACKIVTKCAGKALNAIGIGISKKLSKVFQSEKSAQLEAIKERAKSNEKFIANAISKGQALENDLKQLRDKINYKKIFAKVASDKELKQNYEEKAKLEKELNDKSKKYANLIEAIKIAREENALIKEHIDTLPIAKQRESMDNNEIKNLLSKPLPSKLTPEELKKSAEDRKLLEEAKEKEQKSKTNDKESEKQDKQNMTEDKQPETEELPKKQEEEQQKKTNEEKLNPLSNIPPTNNTPQQTKNEQKVENGLESLTGIKTENNIPNTPVISTKQNTNEKQL